MADPEAQRTTKVSQSAIDDLKKRGMAENLKMYNSGSGTPEFKTAMERYYSPQRLKAGSSQAVKAATPPAGGPKMSNAVSSKPIDMPASASAAATRKVGNPTGTSVLGKPNAAAVSGAVSKVRSVGETGSSIGSSSAKGIGGLVRSLYRGATHSGSARKTT